MYVASPFFPSDRQPYQGTIGSPSDGRTGPTLGPVLPPLLEAPRLSLGWGMYDHQSFQNNEGIGLE